MKLSKDHHGWESPTVTTQRPAYFEDVDSENYTIASAVVQLSKMERDERSSLLYFELLASDALYLTDEQKTLMREINEVHDRRN